MRKLFATEYVTLDGVFGDPGGGDGTPHGGWSFQFWGDDVAKYKFDELFATDAILLGRVTYEGFAKAWPAMKDEVGFADRMNGISKYVVTTTLTPEALTWNNSHIINESLADDIAKLKQQDGQDIMIAGSGDLIKTLAQHNLVDEYRLLVHPVVLGSGRQLFAGSMDKTTMKLTDTKTFSTGIVLLTYEVVK